MSGRVRVSDRQLAEFTAEWAKEYAEWDAIRRELCAGGTLVTAADVTREQEARLRARGETSVLRGEVAKALGVYPPLYVVRGGG